MLGFTAPPRCMSVVSTETSLPSNSLPQEIMPDCVLWLDAADGTSIVQSSGAVSQWSDKSGNGNHAIQTIDANRPVTGVRTINGLNVLDANGSHYMDLAAGLYSMPSGANTLFYVFQNDKVGAYMSFFGQAGSGDNGYTTNFNEGGGTAGRQHKHGGGRADYTSVAGTLPHVHGWIRNGTNLRVFQDHDLLATGTNAGNATLTTFRIIGNGTNRNSDGAWAEVLIFNKALSDEMYAQVVDYLAVKWGIPV